MSLGPQPLLVFACRTSRPTCLSLASASLRRGLVTNFRTENFDGVHIGLVLALAVSHVKELLLENKGAEQLSKKGRILSQGGPGTDQWHADC